MTTTLCTSSPLRLDEVPSLDMGTVKQRHLQHLHPPLATLLDALRQIFALAAIEADSGWFQEHG